MADRLGSPVRELAQGGPRFTEMESAGHRLGQAVTQLSFTQARQEQHPTTDVEPLAPHDPRAVVARTITYLAYSELRMNYPEYRRAGLSVSYAMIESLIKTINDRVKVTKKFWNRSSGVVAILQVRAAALDEADRLPTGSSTALAQPTATAPLR